MCFNSRQYTEILRDEWDDLLPPLVSVQFTGSNETKYTIKQQNVVAEMLVYHNCLSLQIFSC